MGTVRARAAAALATAGALIVASGFVLMATAGTASADHKPSHHPPGQDQTSGAPGNSGNSGNSGNDKKVHKSYVCKYVSTPGDGERLQTGQNPIWVDNHALLGDDGETFVGQEFSDKHGRSVVVVANTAKLTPEPDVSTCGATTPPSSPPPSTSGPNLVSPGATFTDPTCADLDGAGFAGANADKVTYAISSGQVGPGKSVVVKATPKAGFTFPAGTEDEFAETFATIASLDCPSETPTVAGTETTRPRPEKPEKPDEPERGPVVLGTQTAVPSAVDAGLAGTPTGGSGAGTLGLLLVAGGSGLLVASGWLGLGRRPRGGHAA